MDDSRHSWFPFEISQAVIGVLLGEKATGNGTLPVVSTAGNDHTAHIGDEVTQYLLIRNGREATSLNTGSDKKSYRDSINR